MCRRQNQFSLKKENNKMNEIQLNNNQITIFKIEKPIYALVSYTDLVPQVKMRRNVVNHILQESNEDYTYMTKVINISQVEDYKVMEQERAIMDFKVLKVFKDESQKRECEEFIRTLEDTQEEEQLAHSYEDNYEEENEEIISDNEYCEECGLAINSNANEIQCACEEHNL